MQRCCVGRWQQSIAESVNQVAGKRDLGAVPINERGDKEIGKTLVSDVHFDGVADADGVEEVIFTVVTILNSQCIFLRQGVSLRRHESDKIAERDTRDKIIVAVKTACHDETA